MLARRGRLEHVRVGHLVVDVAAAVAVVGLAVPLAVGVAVVHVGMVRPVLALPPGGTADERVGRPDGLDRLRAGVADVGGRLRAGGSRPLPPASTADEDAEDEQEDEEDDGEQDAGDDADLLRECVVDRQDHLLDPQLQRGGLLVEDGAAVAVELGGEAGDLLAVVPEVGLVDDPVEDVRRVGGLVADDLGLRPRVQLGALGLLPAELGGGVALGGGAADLEEGKDTSMRVCIAYLRGHGKMELNAMYNSKNAYSYML